jgi:dipeptidyl-peptidase III
MLANYIEHF